MVLLSLRPRPISVGLPSPFIPAPSISTSQYTNSLTDPSAQYLRQLHRSLNTPLPRHHQPRRSCQQQYLEPRYSPPHHSSRRPEPVVDSYTLERQHQLRQINERIFWPNTCTRYLLRYAAGIHEFWGLSGPALDFEQRGRV